MSGNDEQRDFWSGPSGRAWVAREAAQDRLFSAINVAVLDRAGLATGDRVLDIGCGTGALSVDAAEIVGETGAVLATDIAEPLLARAAERLSRFPQAQTHLGDAATASWPKAPFDHAISRIGVMFFTNPPRAFANIAQALRPGGRMTFAAWAPATVNPYWSGSQRIAVRHLGQPPRTEPNTPGPMGLADRDLTEARFLEAGLSEVSARPEEVSLTFEEGAEALAELLLEIGPAARVVRLFDATAAQRKAVRDDLIAWLEGYQEGETVRLPAVLNMIEATRP